MGQSGAGWKSTWTTSSASYFSVWEKKKKNCVSLHIYRNTNLNLDPESIAHKHGHISCAFIAGRPKGDAHTSMWPDLCARSLIRPTNNAGMNKQVASPNPLRAQGRVSLVAGVSTYFGLIKQFWSNQKQYLALQNLPHLFPLTTSSPKPPDEKQQLSRNQVWLRLLENTPLPKFRLVATRGFTHYRGYSWSLVQITFVSDDFWSEIFCSFVYT